MILLLLSVLFFSSPSKGYWEKGTTTPAPFRTDTHARLCFFRWQRTEFHYLEFWIPGYDWVDIHNRRRLNVIAGVSIDLLPLSTATIMNRRILVTAANYLQPYMNRQKDLRVWALGRAGQYCTPYRYRVWRVWRILPKSNNPEHQHGPRGTHVPRHDVAVIITHDQIYVYKRPPTHYMYAYRAELTPPHRHLQDYIIYTGSGYEYLTHIYENYKIFYGRTYNSLVVDCSKYLPKWWGKFICFRNNRSFPGIQNGGALLDTRYLVGLGCFEIRYNEDRIFVFTDLRYYTYLIYKFADIEVGQYYEYSYPQWGYSLGMLFDSQRNDPRIMWGTKTHDLYPLG